jgi:nitrogen fixation-related uncharacterized protein
MEWNNCLTILTLLGLVFFALTIVMLNWSFKKGHFRNFEEQAKSIFTEDEPLGVQTDFFPGKGKSVFPNHNFKTTSSEVSSSKKV